MPRERADEVEPGTDQNHHSTVSGVEGWPAAPGMQGGVQELLGAVLFAHAGAGGIAGVSDMEVVAREGREPS